MANATDRGEKDNEFFARAITTLADWCKWTVTLETAAIGGIGALIKFEGGTPVRFDPAVGALFTAAIISFGISIIIACLILSDLPTMFVQLRSLKSFWGHGICIIPKKNPDDNFDISLGLLANLHVVLFIFGIVLFGAGVFIMTWWPRVGQQVN